MEKRIRTLWLASVVTLICAGCAVGQKYNLRVAQPELPVAGSGEVAVAVLDQRSHLLNGKDPAIAGIMRGGWGNPFYVTTASGKPLAEDMLDVLVRALERKGYSVTPVGVAANADTAPALGALRGLNKEKALLLAFERWSPDLGAGGRVGLQHRLVLSVLDRQGRIAATAVEEGHDDIGTIKGMSRVTERFEEYAVAAFKDKIEALFSRPEIVGAMR